jgi:hypothetical protein
MLQRLKIALPPVARLLLTFINVRGLDFGHNAPCLNFPVSTFTADVNNGQTSAGASLHYVDLLV